MHTNIEQQTETPKRYQCRHIFTHGRRCGSPCLRGESLCYYHHTTRKPATNPHARRSRSSTFEIPLPEDRSAIQHSIGQVLQRIAANDIDPRRAGLLLYGLQIASLNLPRPQKDAKPEPEPVEEITTDPDLGLLAPPAEVVKPGERRTTILDMVEKMVERDRQERAAREAAAQPAKIPTLQATTDETACHTPEWRSTQHRNRPHRNRPDLHAKIRNIHTPRVALMREQRKPERTARLLRRKTRRGEAQKCSQRTPSTQFRRGLHHRGIQNLGGIHRSHQRAHRQHQRPTQDRLALIAVHPPANPLHNYYPALPFSRTLHSPIET